MWKMSEHTGRGDRETCELNPEKNNSTWPLQELMNVPPESLGFSVNTKKHLLMEGLSAVAESGNKYCRNVFEMLFLHLI